MGQMNSTKDQPKLIHKFRKPFTIGDDYNFIVSNISTIITITLKLFEIGNYSDYYIFLFFFI